MSDFGAILIFKKTTGSISEDDKQLIINTINDELESGTYSSHIKNKKFKELEKWEGESLVIRLTEYYEVEDSDEIREFAEEEDIDEANEIIASISSSLGSDYNISSKFLDW